MCVHVYTYLFYVCMRKSKKLRKKRSIASNLFFVLMFVCLLINYVSNRLLFFFFFCVLTQPRLCGLYGSWFFVSQVHVKYCRKHTNYTKTRLKE